MYKNHSDIHLVKNARDLAEKNDVDLKLYCTYMMLHAQQLVTQIRVLGQDTYSKFNQSTCQTFRPH